MTLDEVYGSKAEHLPRSMVRFGRTDRPGARPYGWVGQPGVELLNLDENLSFERESVARFPRRSDATIRWDDVEDELVLSSTDSDSVDLSILIQEHFPAPSTVVLFWGSLALPSVRLDLAIWRGDLSEIEESSPEFWIYSPSQRVVLEYTFSGSITIGLVPGVSG